jgi:hypothetical protein
LDDDSSVCQDTLHSDDIELPVNEPPPLPRWMWTVTGLRALVAGTLGVTVLLGNLGRSALANFIAVYWLVGSLLTLKVAFAPGSRSRTAAAAGMLGVVAALVVLARLPLQGVVAVRALLPLLGCAAILTGVLRLGGGFRDDQIAPGRFRMSRRMVLGALEVLLGGILLVSEQVSRTVALVVGVWGIVGGTTLVVDALAMWEAARHRT